MEAVPESRSERSQSGLSRSCARVLCVDDNALFLKVLRRCLEKSGMQVVTACDGLEALAEIENQPQAFDALITDNDMPELGGLDLVRLARNRGFQGNIVIMSGNFCDSDRLHYEPYTIAGFFSKPFETQSLVNTIISS